MHSLSIANSERIITDDSSSALPQKFKTVINLLKGSEKLYTFFNKLFKRKELQNPSAEQAQYLYTLLDHLADIIPESPPEKLDILVFQTLVRYNFNHESVCRYYWAAVDHILANNPGKEVEMLEKLQSYSEVLMRKDMAYNQAGHSLQKEITHLLHQRLKQLDDFRPFRLLVNANVFFPLVALLYEAKVIKKQSPAKTRESLIYAFRDSEGERFSKNTVKNRLSFDSQCNIDELKVLLDKLSEKLDYQMKVRLRLPKRLK